MSTTDFEMHPKKKKRWIDGWMERDRRRDGGRPHILYGGFNGWP